MTTGFLTPFSVTYVDRRNRRLNSDLDYVDRTFGLITASAGFVTDLASIYDTLRYIAPLLYALLAGYGDQAATIHDWLYRGYGILRKGQMYYPTRKEADQIMYNALREEGVARWRAFIFYAGVRMFGASSFNTTHKTFKA